MAGTVRVDGDTVTVTIHGRTDTRVLGVLGISRFRSTKPPPQKALPMRTAVTRPQGSRVWLRAVAAVVVMAGFAAGVPWALLTTIGNPYPAGGIDWADPVTDAALLGLLAVLAWIFWVQMIRALSSRSPPRSVPLADALATGSTGFPARLPANNSSRALWSTRWSPQPSALAPPQAEHPPSTPQSRSFGAGFPLPRRTRWHRLRPWRAMPCRWTATPAITTAAW